MRRKKHSNRAHCIYVNVMKCSVDRQSSLKLSMAEHKKDHKHSLNHVNGIAPLPPSPPRVPLASLVPHRSPRSRVLPRQTSQHFEREGHEPGHRTHRKHHPGPVIHFVVPARKPHADIARLKLHTRDEQSNGTGNARGTMTLGAEMWYESIGPGVYSESRGLNQVFLNSTNSSYKRRFTN